MCLSCGESKKILEKRRVMTLQLPLTKRFESLEDGILGVLNNSNKICICWGKTVSVGCSSFSKSFLERKRLDLHSDSHSPGPGHAVLVRGYCEP